MNKAAPFSLARTSGGTATTTATGTSTRTYTRACARTCTFALVFAAALRLALGVTLAAVLVLALTGCSPDSFGAPPPPPPPSDPGGGGGGTQPPPAEPPRVYGRVLGHVVMENAYAGRAASTSAAPGVVVQGAVRTRPLATPGGPSYSQSEFLASFRRGASADQIRAAAERHGYSVKRVIEGTGIYVIAVPRGTDPAEAAEGFKEDPLVAHAQPNYTARVGAAPATGLVAPAGSAASAAQAEPVAQIAQASAPGTARIERRVPNDPYYPRQWGPEAMSLPYAWGFTTGSSSVTVAVIDTGVQTDHPDLAGHITAGYDFYNRTTYVRDINGHGTHVAGIIGAVTNNAVGMAGINWNVRIMPLKATDDSGSGYLDLSMIIEALRYAADHAADVVNMSFQIGDASTGEDPFMDQAIEYAYNKGVTMVAAAGNDGEPWIAYPARDPRVIAVGAVSPDLALADWSNYGSGIDVVAPGVDILSTWPTNSFANASGTSMATPHVAGLAALMIASGVRGPASVAKALHETAMDLGSPGQDSEYGWGLVNAHAAVTGSSITTMKVFAGEDDGTTLTYHSAMASPAPGGLYEVREVEAGSWYIYGWIDVNHNGTIDDGDYYGRTSGRVTSNGDTVTGVDLRVRINAGSAPSAGPAGSAGSQGPAGSAGSGATRPVRLTVRGSAKGR
ncbi:MAG: S8 family serine peptidase [Bacillota bacterium]|nr:S8 family serine peptidase [Bacillota bacterium]